MAFPVARFAWYGAMSLFALSLWGLEVVSHDYSANTYVVLAIVAILVNPAITLFKKIKWLLEPTAAEETTLGEEELSGEKLREENDHT